jgi:hypothetical protein
MDAIQYLETSQNMKISKKKHKQIACKVHNYNKARLREVCHYSLHILLLNMIKRPNLVIKKSALPKIWLA